MRILFVPVFNYPGNLNADSIYQITREWCRRMCEIDLDMAIYCVLPSPCLDDPYRKHEYEHKPIHPRVHEVFLPTMRSYVLNEISVDFDAYSRFHPVFGDMPVDAVVSTSAVKTVALERVICSMVPMNLGTTLFNMDLLMRGLDTNEVSGVTDETLILQSSGQTMGFNLFESQKCKKMAIGAARKFLSASMLDRISKNSAVVYTGYDDTTLKDVPIEEKNEVFTVIVRGRLTASKHVDRILGVYNALYASGRDMKIQLTTGDIGNSFDKLIREQFSSNSAIDIMKLKSKADSLEVMRKAHAFLFWSDHELFAVSVWEMFASGLIGVFKRADWLEGLLPKEYPFVFDKELEAYAMLSDIQENYTEWKKKLAWMVDFVRDNYGYTSTTKAASDAIRLNSKATRPRDWVADLIKEHGLPEMTIPKAFEVVAEHAQLGEQAVFSPQRAYRSRKIVGGLEVVHAMLQSGYKDDLESAVPAFRR